MVCPHLLQMYTYSHQRESHWHGQESATLRSYIRRQGRSLCELRSRFIHKLGRTVYTEDRPLRIPQSLCSMLLFIFEGVLPHVLACLFLAEEEGRVRLQHVMGYNEKVVIWGVGVLMYELLGG